MNNLTWEQRQAMARQREQQYAGIVDRQRLQGGQMYAGGDPNFDERTGQPVQRPALDYMGQGGAQGQFRGQPFGVRDWTPEPRNGDNYLQMLMKKYGSAAQGFGGEIGDWFKNRIPNANREYMGARHRFIQKGMGDQ